MSSRGRNTAPGRGRRPGTAARTPARTSGRGPSRSRQVSRGPQAQAPRPRYTNRMALLVVVMAVLVVSYASSMRAYLQQRDNINDLKAQIASSQKDIKSLKREKARWHDDAYVKTQARERFGWVLPGEVAYQVLDRNGEPLTSEQTLTDPSTVARKSPVAWWAKAQTSLDAADHPEKYSKPIPADSITKHSKGAGD